MKTNIDTEEAFKKLLKSLFAEKKRVKEEQKTPSVKEKIELKAHPPSFSQQAEVESYKNQLTKAKSALNKLVEDLKQAREEIETLHAEHKKAKALIGQLEEEKEQTKDLQGEVVRLEEGLAIERAEKKQLKHTLKAKEQEWQEMGRMKGERMHLVERLAECLSQMQRQTEIIKDLQDKLGNAEKEKQV